MLAVAAPAAVYAQVFDPGPSDPGLFTNGFFNVPPGNAPGNGIGNLKQLNLFDGGSIGGFYQAYSGSEVNVFGGLVLNNFTAYSGSEVNISGGSIGEEFTANAGSVVNLSGGSVARDAQANDGSVVNIAGGNVEAGFDASYGSQVNISGGHVGRAFNAYSRSEVNISGGSLGSGFAAFSNSEVNLSGGSVGIYFRNNPGSDVELIGGDFRLNGVPYTEATISMLAFNDDVFSGTLQDGSAFIFSGAAHDTLSSVTLTNVPLPAIDPTPTVVNTALPNRPFGLRAGQTLTLQDGGELVNFEATGGTINIVGGSLGSGAGTTNAVVNLSGGSVGSSFKALSGSVINISGGSVGAAFDATAGSVVHISGGTVGDQFEASAGSEVNISGGSVGNRFAALPGSDVELIGGDYRLNGVAYTAATITLTGSDVFTGTLQDGSTFIFQTRDYHSPPLPYNILSDVTLTTAVLPEIDPTPIVVNTAMPTGPSGLRAGQTLILQDGGELVNFEATGGTINVEGGSIGPYAGVTNAVVNIDGGRVGDNFSALSGSVVNVSGGSTGYAFQAHSGSTLNVSGGSIGGPLEALSGSEVNFSGGSLKSYSFFSIRTDSTVNISGGSIEGQLRGDSGSQIRLFGTEFLIDGVLLENLVLDETFNVNDRVGDLSGTLADGSTFNFDLRSSFDEDAMLSVTLVDSLGQLDGDYNSDGVVDAVDYTVWRDNLGSFIALPGDTTPGVVDGADYAVWRDNYGTAESPRSSDGTSTPEPTSLVLLISALSIARAQRRKSCRSINGRLNAPAAGLC